MFSIQNNQLWGCALATTEHPRWDDSTDYGTYGIDLFNLSIVPGGSRGTAFGYIGKYALLWTTTEVSGRVKTYDLYYTDDSIYFANEPYKRTGYSVRCVREAIDIELAYHDGEIIKDTYTDGDTNTYDGVKIGTQIWTTKNLKTTKYQTQDPIPHVTDDTTWSNLTTSAYCWYDNNINWKDIYGALYNWYTVANELVSGVWRVPTESDVVTLRNYVIKEYDYMGYTSSNIARVLKSCRQINHPLN